MEIGLGKINEVKKAVDDLAYSVGRRDVNWTIRCAQALGLRLEEVTALTKAQIREALKKILFI